jgi:hypothetical protein
MCGVAPQVPIHSNNVFHHHYVKVSGVKNRTSYPKFECRLPPTIQLSSLTIDLQFGCKCLIQFLKTTLIIIQIINKFCK